MRNVEKLFKPKDILQHRVQILKMIAFKLLERYRLNDKAYDNLYRAYEFLSTLSVTRVNCERTFSKLKLIKTKLRNMLMNEQLMNVKVDILLKLSNTL